MVTESMSTEKVSRRDGPHQDLWSCFEEIVASDDNVPSGSRNLEKEVNAFLALPLQPLQLCPGGFLTNKCTQISSTSRLSISVHQVQAYTQSACSVRLRTFPPRHRAVK